VTGWADRPSGRQHRLPPDWLRRRAAVLRRDRGLCTLRLDGCTVQATDVDHVGDSGDHALANLRAVCRKCHDKRTAQQGAGARAVRYRRKREPEPHPGML
jgi:5-methylcytosine-specific restriction protein A